LLVPSTSVLGVGPQVTEGSKQSVEFAAIVRECWDGATPDDEHFEGKARNGAADYLEKFKPYRAEFPALRRRAPSRKTRANSATRQS
jgi:hypothetical protein